MVTTSWTQTAGMTSDTDTDNIEDYVEQAEASKDAAAASETAAADSASVASTSASSAATDAASALNSKNAAAVSETNAATSETNAASSAASASTSATSASTSASNSATNAASSASSAAAASTSETNSASSAAAALVSENAAAASETAASASASAASTSEANAAASETAAAASETAAAASETAAQTAQAAAEAAEAATEALFDQFGDQYLGPKASDPTVDNDGNPLAEGAVYFNTTDDVLKFYSGSAWVAPESIATTAANEAQASATAAATSETNAASSASSASTSETNAATSASSASTSETNAATSETNAASSASAASASEANAAASEAASATSESNAASSASSASTSASNAATSESNAASSASSASTSEANADTSEANALTYSSNAATSAAAAASSAAGIAGYDLDVIAETKGVTAVDVFVYDTSKDSDGGAWRKRTQGTSWYNETLNTATRGSRREFPAIAVIVAESTKVTIYDGDDPSLPMWMVFNVLGSGIAAANYALLISGSYPVTSLSMSNGSLCVTGYYLHRLNFISEHQALWGKVGHERPVPISKRNVAVLWQNNEALLGQIVSAYCNDVAMTVLPNAPIDAATGLPVPTIAVATAGGVSVIKDDGTVVDSATTLGSSYVIFDNAYGIYYRRNITTGVFWYASQADYEAGDGFGDEVARPTAGTNDFDLLTFGSLSLSGDGFAMGGDTLTNEAKFGLSQYAPNTLDFTKGMSALFTSTYNTGWMNGDIKGAFLSDTDTADLVGSGELISNGGFDTDLTGWTDSSTGTGSVDASNGAAVLTGADPSNRGSIRSDNFATIAGQTYTLTLDVSGAGGNYQIQVKTSGGTNLSDNFGSLGNGVKTYTFTAITTLTYVTMNVYHAGSVTFDNISVKLADADRSVNNNGLVVSSKTYDPWHDDLNLAFDDESFTVDREASDFMSAITHDASSNATMTGSYGPELVTNGGFADATGWTEGTGWAISGGVATCTSGNASLVYTGSTGDVTDGSVHEIRFRITDYTSGSLYVAVGGGTTAADRHYIASPTTGEYVVLATAGSTSNRPVELFGGAFIGSIDNISVREVPKVQWRPHNLLAYSEDFTQSAWTKTSTTVTGDAAVAPDGTTTATEISHTSTSASVFQTPTSVDGVVYAGGIFVKYIDHQWFRLDFDAGQNVWVDIQNGVIGTDNTDGTTLTALSNGWYYISTSDAAGGTGFSWNFQLAAGDGSTIETSGTSAYIWGAHLYRNDLGGMAPVPTDFQTAGSTTYVRTAGREVTGTELVTNGTFDTDTSGWFIHGSTTATVSSGQVTVTGDGGFDERIEQSFSTKIGTAYRVTGDYIGGSSGSQVTARDFGGAYTVRGSQALSSAGQFDFAFVAASESTLIQIYQYDSAAGSTIYDNISVKEIDVDPTTARYLPRLGHHVYNGSAWVNEGLLHESEARTNLGLGSNTPSDTTYWRTTATQNGITHTVIGTGVENGAAYLDVRYVGTATNTFHSQLYASTATRTAASTGQTYVASLTGRVIDGSNPAGTGIVTLINQEIAPSTFLSTTASSAAGSLSYIDESTDKTIFTRQTVSGSTNQVYGGCAFTFTNGETIDVTYRLKLFQFELGQMPSSYIPTSGATATRASESLTIPAANLPYSSTSMTIQMDGRMTYADEDAYNTVRPVRWSFDSSNVIEIKIDTVSGTGDPIFVQGASGVYDIVQNTSEYSPDILAPYSISSRHGSTFINGAVDGVALTANTTPTALPDLSSTDLQLGFTYNGTIRNFRMWGNDIKDDGIEVVTQPSLSPSLGLSFDGSEASQIQFDWSEK